MVKLREGVVLTKHEKQWFDLQNSNPRRESGRVDFYFKPVTKYPARIYVFMHAEMWRSRNRRPMGLHYSFPIISRPMNKEEIEYHHFNIRLCYYQYDSWEKLIYAEEKEAEELDKEQPGKGIEFIKSLKDLKHNYKLS